MNPVILEPEAAATIERVWSELQADLLGISTNSSRVIANGSGHDIQRDATDVVIGAISDMLERVERAASQ